MKLKWENEANSNLYDCYVLKRQSDSVRPFLPPHSHDYSEIFFVQKGNCIYNVNNKKISVSKNSIIFTRPDIDQHSIESHSSDFEIIQLLFNRDSYQFIIDRYCGKGLENNWNNDTDTFQHIFSINPLWFENNFNRLLTADGSLFELERFLINLLDHILPRNSNTVIDEKDWLDKALMNIRKPENFNKGVPGFVSLCNKSIEHIERKVKRKTGLTISQIVNKSRMLWASYMLIYTDYDIQNISLDCGYNSLTHFYRVFNSTFGSSPSKYRKSKKNSEEIDIKNEIRFLYNPFILMDDDKIDDFRKKHYQL